MERPRHFLSCDWGTSAFRLRLVRRVDLAVVGERVSDRGVALVANAGEAGPERGEAFADYLRGQVRDICETGGRDPAGCPVAISGMAGSSIGWHELPYALVPFALDGSDALTHLCDLDCEDGRQTRVVLISGVRTDDDVMRGEETEIVGLFAGDELGGFAEGCTLILPGTHSKHVRIRRGQMTGFRTFMTGEVFAVLREHSILRHSTETVSRMARPCGEGREAFARGVRRGGRGELLSALFRVRTRELLDGLPAGPNSWYLSGLLIGAELGSLRGGDGPVIVCAGGGFREIYGLAVEEVSLDREHVLVDTEVVEQAVVRGHARLLEASGCF